MSSSLYIDCSDLVAGLDKQVLLEQLHHKIAGSEMVS